MRFSLVVLLAVLLSGIVFETALAAPTGREFAVAINQSGRQRMLSQKMSKEFLLTISDIDIVANKTELAKTVKFFDETLTRLIKGDAASGMPAPPNEAIMAQLLVVQGIWTRFHSLIEAGLQAKPDAAALTVFARESLHLVTEMDKAVTLYEQASVAAGIKGTGAVVNVAGRQRMLSQRMSKDIVLITLGVEVEASRKDLVWARDLFERSLQGLTDGDASMNLPPTENKAIRDQLAQTKLSWVRFKELVDAVADSPDTPRAALLKEVSVLNPRLLLECQKVVAAYEAEVQ